MKSRTFILIAGILGLIGVALGAFGAHGLEQTLLDNGRADTYETAAHYHLIHTVALLGIAWLIEYTGSRFMRWAGWWMIAGIVIFSGSLYLLAMFDLGIMGAIAPIGGTVLIIAWGLVAYGAWKAQ